jgi:hypothetical protein
MSYWKHPDLGIIHESQQFELGSQRYPAFWLRDSQAEALALGFTAVPDIAPARDPADIARDAVLAEIERLEAIETKRRIAEAMPDDAGGTPDGRAWLAANRVAIAALRAGL